MNKFGVVKTKLLSKIVESYSTKNKKEIKNLINTVNEDKDFKELYLLYEDVENKYFSDSDTAKFYVEELSKSLNGKSKKTSKITNKVDSLIGLVETQYLPVYDMLDCLMEDDNLLNIEPKMMAKINLVSHLITKKETNESKTEKYAINESLLYSVLTNNFNVLYSNTLNEEEKKELKSILSLTEEDLQNKFIELKESINENIGGLLKESNDFDLINKLNQVKDEVSKMSNSRLNFYKLLQLKNGL